MVTTLNNWISINAIKMMERLSLYSMLDEDAFQDAYLSLSTAINGAEQGAIIERRFVAEYNRISGKHINEAYTTVHPEELFFNLLPNEDAPESDALKFVPKKLIEAIKRYIRQTFPSLEVVAWEMNLNKASLRDISDITGLTRCEIIKSRKEIASKTRNKFNQQIKKYGYEIA